MTVCRVPSGVTFLNSPMRLFSFHVPVSSVPFAVIYTPGPWARPRTNFPSCLGTVRNPRMRRELSSAAERNYLQVAIGLVHVPVAVWHVSTSNLADVDHFCSGKADDCMRNSRRRKQYTPGRSTHVPSTSRATNGSFAMHVIAWAIHSLALSFYRCGTKPKCAKRKLCGSVRLLMSSLRIRQKTQSMLSTDHGWRATRTSIDILLNPASRRAAAVSLPQSCSQRSMPSQNSEANNARVAK